MIKTRYWVISVLLLLFFFLNAIEKRFYKTGIKGLPKCYKTIVDYGSQMFSSSSSSKQIDNVWSLLTFSYSSQHLSFKLSTKLLHCSFTVRRASLPSSSSIDWKKENKSNLWSKPLISLLNINRPIIDEDWESKSTLVINLTGEYGWWISLSFEKINFIILVNLFWISRVQLKTILCVVYCSLHLRMPTTNKYYSLV